MSRAFFSSCVLAVLGLAVSVLAIAYRIAGPRDTAASPEQNAPLPEVPVATHVQVAEVTEPQVSPAQWPSGVTSALELAPALPGVSPVEPTPYLRQLVASLAKLEFNEGAITREQAEQWKQQFGTLVEQGAAAVPAIREFLAQNREFNFDAISGGEFLGQHSLRAAFFDALQHIGGPEAEGLMLQTLQTTTLPSEIALLANHVDQQSPGLYRQEILNAAHEVLSLSEKGQLPDWDVGPLFQVLQQYGDASTAATLEQLRSKWNYYATLSLTGMQNGEGIPLLIHEAQNTQGDRGTKRDLVFQMLAQAATQSSDAATALIEQAQGNQIPESAWRKIASGLAGDQYGIGLPPGLNPATKTLPGLKTYHLASGNQNFYSVPAAISADERQRRRALIEQLLAVSSSPSAIQALAAAQLSLATATAKR